MRWAGLVARTWEKKCIHAMGGRTVKGEEILEDLESDAVIALELKSTGCE